MRVYAVKYGFSSLLPDIDDAGFDRHALAKIIIALNGASNSIAYTSPAIRNKPHWFVGGGVGSSGMTISGDHQYLGQVGFKNAVAAPYLLIGFDYLFSQGLGPWGMRLELAYFSATYKATGVSYGTSLDQTTYTLQQNNFAPCAYVLYHFVNRPSFKIYVAPGFGVNFSSYPKNILHDSWPQPLTRDNYADLSSFWLSANLKLGVILNERIEAGAAGIYGNYSKQGVYSFDPHTYLFWVAYRLN